MKIFIAGATGRVAKFVVEGLLAKGHTLVCGSRHPELLTESERCKPVLLDLHDDVSKIQELINGCDAVYFLAGSRGKDLLQTDAFGAVKLMWAAEAAGISRYIMLSSLYALEPEKWAVSPSLQKITNYNISKFFADHYLIHSTSLNYTIIQPSILKEEPATGKIEIDPASDGANPIPDVAAVLCSVLDKENTYRKVIKCKSGDTPIETALAAV